MKYVLVILLFLLASETVSFACSCIPPKSPREELEQSTAVFSGKVVRIERAEEGTDPFTQVEVVFEVEGVWKGTDKSKVSVFTSLHSAACGYGFRTGEKYLVYANDNRSGQLVTTICSRTKPTKDADADLGELGEAKKPTK